MINIRFTREHTRVQLCTSSSADVLLTINIRLLEARGDSDWCSVNSSYCLLAGSDQSLVISDDRTFRF